MCIPYRIAQRIVNGSSNLVVTSLVWIYNEGFSVSPLILVPSWELFIAAIILSFPPIWFSAVVIQYQGSKLLFALSTCVIDWVALLLIMPSNLIEGYLLGNPSHAIYTNLTFFVTILLLALVICPTWNSQNSDSDLGLSVNQKRILLIIFLLAPVVVTYSMVENAFYIQIESISWFLYTQSMASEIHQLSDFIISVQGTPTFPIRILEFTLSLLFLSKLSQYSRGQCRKWHVILLGLLTLSPSILNSLISFVFHFRLLSVFRIPIPILLFAGIHILKRIQSPISIESSMEEVDIQVPLLHRIRSRLWRKNK